LAVTVTVVVPGAKTDPLAGDAVSIVTPTASVAVGVKVTFAPLGLVACTVKLAGPVTTGAVVSCTVTVKLPVAVFPALSVALAFTVVVPIGNVLPLAGRKLLVATPLPVSLALAV
jgi:hypothetical protein